MPLIWGITKVVPKTQEDAANFDVLIYTFMEAYYDLRKSCPLGDLRIHLSVEGSAEEVGAHDAEVL